MKKLFVLMFTLAGSLSIHAGACEATVEQELTRHSVALASFIADWERTKQRCESARQEKQEQYDAARTAIAVCLGDPYHRASRR